MWGLWLATGTMVRDFLPITSSMQTRIAVLRIRMLCDTGRAHMDGWNMSDVTATLYIHNYRISTYTVKLSSLYAVLGVSFNGKGFFLNTYLV